MKDVWEMTETVDEIPMGIQGVADASPSRLIGWDFDDVLTITLRYGF